MYKPMWCVCMVVLTVFALTGCGSDSDGDSDGNNAGNNANMNNMDADVGVEDMGDEEDVGEDVGGDDVGEDTGEDMVEGCENGETRPCDIIDGCQGVQTCDGIQFGDCVAPAEVCDGLDNDCDGEVDNGFAGLGDTCSAGEGACMAEGTTVCNEAGDGVACDATPGDPGDEVCDGADNNCDGEVDNVEGLGDACSAGEGACMAEGVLACDAEAGALSCDAVPGEPGDEVCDGLDNDCDGEVDNVEGLGDACSAGDGACMAEGVFVCDAEAGALACDAVPGDPGDEVCDGLDNNCDGEVDNVEGAGDACSAGEGACMAEGVLACDAEAGALACDAVPGEPGDEVCDGLDNNCDGEVDNVEGAGDACSAGEGACMVEGVLVCDAEAGALACDVVPGEPGDEVCDGLDNNCDGEVDNVEGLGEACSSGQGICEAAGVLTCDGENGALMCDAVEGEPQEVENCFNDLDDDCDGLLDCEEEACAEACAAECRFSDECSEGEVCSEGACVVGDCVVDEDCEPELVCNANICSPPNPMLEVAALGEFAQTRGSLDDTDPQWDRLGSTCAGGGEPDHYFDLVEVTNNTGRAQMLTIGALWSGDGYLHVFRAPFVPGMVDNCVRGDDDFDPDGDGPLVLADGSQITDVEIADGETLVVVLSTFDDNAAIGAWGLAVLTQPPPGEFNDTFDVAEPIVVGSPLERALDVQDDVDWYTFTIAEETLVTIETSSRGNDNDADTQMWLCDDTDPANCTYGGGNIGSNDDIGGGNLFSRLSDISLAPGTYYIGVQGFRGGTGEYAVVALPVFDAQEIETPLSGESVDVMGSLMTPIPQWGRANGCNGAPGDPNHYFDLVEVTNNTGSAQRLDLSVTWAGDGYLHVFRTPLRPRTSATVRRATTMVDQGAR